MSNYILHLKNDNYNIKLPLFLKEANDFLDDYFDKCSGEYVYNDYTYSLSITDESGRSISGECLFVNNEIIEDYVKPSCIFRECFGIIRIEVIISGASYITQNTRVAMKESSINSSIINMIDYIYDNCDKFLYEEHKYSKSEFGVMPNEKISIDTKLSLINEIYDVYVKGYNILKHSAQTKLVNANKIGDFNELLSIGQNTINYIVNHTEELQPVNYNSGISVNKQYYEPRKTLVQSVAYSCDIYENQVIVGFLKTVVQDLDDIKSTVEKSKSLNAIPYRRNGYVDSAYYIYTRNTKMLNSYLEGINACLLKIQKLYVEYKRILNVSDITVVAIPRYTNIFRRIMPYNIMFKKIFKWFNCGNYDLSKSDLLLSFVSISKIYEYFCLLKINLSLEKCGFNLVSGFPFKYAENQYYHNTSYNNTFVFSKDNVNVTVYYQPIIYGKTYGRERPNGIGLFRNTTISITNSAALALLDESEANRGNYYVPDYLIKISNVDTTNYYILDAKHSSSNTIKRYQLPYLVFKYLFSISALSKDGNVAGMCILCGKSATNSSECLYDVADKFNIQVTPCAQICNITGSDVDNDTDLVAYINRIIDVMLKSQADLRY